jgi:hypothetical protein
MTDGNGETRGSKRGTLAAARWAGATEWILAIWESTAFRLSLILGMGLAFLLPRNIDYIQSGLDSSWVYVINLAASLGWKFGDDILFSCGPLGFLSYTCGVGRNIEITLFVTGILVFGHVWLLWRFVSRSGRPIGTGRMLAACLLLWVMPLPPFDGYLLYLVLLLLSIAWFSPNKRGYFLGACALTTLQLFIMFAGALSCCAAIGMFWLFWAIKDRSTWRTFCWIPLWIPGAFVAGYLLYHPSWAGLWGYVKGAVILMGSYSSAMSFVNEPLYTWMTLACGGIYAVVLLQLAVGNRSAAQYVFLFAGCVALAMKHGLVRADMWHFDVVLYTSLSFFSLIILFAPPSPGSRNRATKVLAMAGGAALLLLLPMLDLPDAVRKGREYYRVVYAPTWNRGSSILGVADKIANPLKGADPLPADILRSIGTNSVAFYPLELSLAAYNPVRLAVMPVLQAYTAHAPFLDGRNARFFADNVKAPDYIVFSLRVLDGRWPLIESPLAWTTIYEHYDVHAVSAPFLLLKRRAIARNVRYTVLASAESATERTIVLPATEGMVLIGAEMQLNLWGRMAKTLFRVPPVTMRAAFANGLVVEGRCIPENLASKTLVSFLPLPFELRQTADFIQTGHVTNRAERIAFGGPGLPYYRKTMRVTLYEGQMVNADGTADEPAGRELEK